MKKGRLVVLLLLLISAITLAAVYKWVDESGRVHYGDAPPEGSDAETVIVPEGPSENEVERARQQVQEKKERYEKITEEPSPPAAPEESPREAENPVVVPDDVACGSPLSDLVKGPSAKTYTPISPTTLTKAQRRSLRSLFKKAEASWKGTITESTCLGSSPEAGMRTAHFVAETMTDWDAHKSQLVVDTDTVGKESRVTRQLIHILEVGDALYISDTKTPDFIKKTDTIAIEGNKVEILALDRKLVSFLIKRRVPTGDRARIPRAEIRQLAISTRSFKLTELYYHNEMLTGSSAWVLKR